MIVGSANIETLAEDAATIESDIQVSLIVGSPTKTLLAMLSSLYMPILTSGASGEKGIGALAEDQRGEFFNAVNRFVDVLGESVNGLEGGLQLMLPQERIDVENKQPAMGALTLPHNHQLSLL